MWWSNLDVASAFRRTMTRCCKDAGKRTLLFFRFVLLVSGLGLVGFGIFLAVEPAKHYKALLPDGWDLALGFIFLLGFFLMVTGITGCCFSLCDDCLKTMVIKLLILIQSALMYLAVAVALNLNLQLEETRIKHDYKGPGSDDLLSESWDNFQRDLKCCAVNGYLDYQGSNYSLTSGHPVPSTCCVMENGRVQNKTLCYKEAEQHPASKTFSFLNDKGCSGQTLSSESDRHIGIVFLPFLGFFSLVVEFCILIRQPEP